MAQVLHQRAKTTLSIPKDIHRSSTSIAGLMGSVNMLGP